MTQHEGPPRLKAGKDASPELLHALRALGNQHNNPPRLARAAENLDKVLHALPAAPSAPAVKSRWLLRLARNKVLAMRLAIALLAVGGGSIVWLGRSPRSEQPWAAGPRGPSAEDLSPPVREAARTTPEGASSVLSARETVRTTPDGVSSVLPAREALRTTSDRDSSSPRVRKTAARARSNADRNPMRTAGVATETRPSVAERASPLDRAPSQPTREANAAQAQAQPKASQVTTPAARERSEIELLFAARQQLQSDVRAGLRLLDEHRARFPNGQLAPEREVLAIEVLRKLGQTDAAAKRFAEFEQRYPDSLHLQRLRQSK